MDVEILAENDRKGRNLTPLNGIPGCCKVRVDGFEFQPEKLDINRESTLKDFLWYLCCEEQENHIEAEVVEHLVGCNAGKKQDP